MHNYWLEDTNLLRWLLIAGFLLSEVLLLTALLTLGIALSAIISSDLSIVEVPSKFLDEAFRAFGASVLFIVLSGYLVSVIALTLIFRANPISGTRALLLVLLFAVHAGVFLFYFRAPADFMTSAILMTVGVVCVIVVTILEYLLWRRWLPPRSMQA